MKKILQGYLYSDDDYGVLGLYDGPQKEFEHNQPDYQVAAELEELRGKQVFVRYTITDRKVTPAQAEKAVIERSITGQLDAEFILDAYSEYTIMELKEQAIVGGHDLIEELRSHDENKYCIITVDYGQGIQQPGASR